MSRSDSARCSRCSAGAGSLACALAALTTLASPVAGFFVSIAAVAWSLAPGARRGSRRPEARPPGPRHASSAPSAGARRLRGAALAAAALAPAAILAALFPEGGTEPFVASAFWPALVALGLVAAALPARERTLRIGAALYALTCVAAFVLPTALGGNATRLGALVAGPVVAGAIARRARPPGDPRRPCPAARLLAALSRGARRRARERRPLHLGGLPRAARALPRSAPGSFRVEIPFTENHWEAAHVAPHVALARGWERQLDRRYGALFYDGTLTPASYRAWLDEHAVAYVARARRPARLRRARRGAAHRAAACPTCARSGATRTGACSRSAGRRRSSRAPHTRSRCNPTASSCSRRAPGRPEYACVTRAGGLSRAGTPASSGGRTGRRACACCAPARCASKPGSAAPRAVADAAAGSAHRDVSSA